MQAAHFITAIGTPRTEDESLHEEGLRAHLADQWNSGADGILVAGGMGTMQTLTDKTYRDLVERSVELTRDGKEIMVGAGDAAFARTRDRILFLNTFKLAGVAVLTPYLYKFNQSELTEYFSRLADISKSPLYLYDLPAFTGVSLSVETVLKLAKHPNIAGIKCSRELSFGRTVIDALGDSFRVIMADAYMVDMMLRHGICYHLDGMWAMAPSWTFDIGKCAARGDWEGAAANQRKLIELKNVVILKYGFGAFTDVMNARGIPGDFVPRPFTRLDNAQRERLLGEPIVQKLLAEDPAK